MSDQDQGPFANIADAHEMGGTRRTVYEFNDKLNDEIRVSAAEYIRDKMWAAIVGVSLDTSELSLVRLRIEDASERIASHITQANIKARCAEKRADEDAQQHRATVESLRESMGKQSSYVYDLRLEIKNLQAEYDKQAHLISDLTCIKPTSTPEFITNAEPKPRPAQDARAEDPDVVAQWNSIPPGATEMLGDPNHLAQRMDALCRQLGGMLTTQQATLERVEQIEGRLNAKR
jgi:hypothetical protein